MTRVALNYAYIAALILRSFADRSRTKRGYPEYSLPQLTAMPKPVSILPKAIVTMVAYDSYTDRTPCFHKGLGFRDHCLEIHSRTAEASRVSRGPYF